MPPTATDPHRHVPAAVRVRAWSDIYRTSGDRERVVQHTVLLRHHRYPNMYALARARPRRLSVREGGVGGQVVGEAVGTRSSPFPPLCARPLDVPVCPHCVLRYVHPLACSPTSSSFTCQDAATLMNVPPTGTSLVFNAGVRLLPIALIPPPRSLVADRTHTASPQPLRACIGRAVSQRSTRAAPAAICHHDHDAGVVSPSPLAHSGDTWQVRGADNDETRSKWDELGFEIVLNPYEALSGASQHHTAT
jgi:hypothetical protein